MVVRSLKTKARPTTSLFENKVIEELQSLPKLDKDYEHTYTQNNDETGGPKGLEQHGITIGNRKDGAPTSN